MTITCAECELPYAVTTDDHIVACPWCDQATFSPGAPARGTAGWL